MTIIIESPSHLLCKDLPNCILTQTSAEPFDVPKRKRVVKTHRVASTGPSLSRNLLSWRWFYSWCYWFNFKAKLIVRSLSFLPYRVGHRAQWPEYSLNTLSVCGYTAYLLIPTWCLWAVSPSTDSQENMSCEMEGEYSPPLSNSAEWMAEILHQC